MAGLYTTAIKVIEIAAISRVDQSLKVFKFDEDGDHMMVEVEHTQSGVNVRSRFSKMISVIVTPSIDVLGIGAFLTIRCGNDVQYGPYINLIESHKVLERSVKEKLPDLIREFIAQSL